MERSWGINKTAFYDGEDAHSSDDLEKEEVDLTQLRIYSTFDRSDFQSPWFEFEVLQQTVSCQLQESCLICLLPS